MSKKQANAVPASLIEHVGTGEDTKGVIGKRIRVTAAPKINPDSILVLLGITNGDPIPVGSEGTIVHVSAEGAYWVDFTDSPTEVQGQGPDNQPIWDVGSVNDEDGKTDVDGFEYEFIA